MKQYMENGPDFSAQNSPSSLKQIRYAIATAFGVTEQGRSTIVGAMLNASLAESVGYWFQLVLSMAIATLGLVLSSSGVVIAAMLIAPLMGPIVQIGMALAIGSPVMAIRASVRAAGSIVVVIGSAMLITLVLPFHEVTPEIAARTSPTVLDLIVAGCCALAGAFATVRPASETTGTAAGTAIGIALVPPLCVVGFGLGSGRPDVAAGASLLFTANLCAILLFALLMFIVLGFDQVNVAELENASLRNARGDRLTLVLARLLKGVIGSRYSVVLRILMPLALMFSVYLPLRQALEEVTWQVRVRGAILRILQESPVIRNAVRSVISVEKKSVTVRLVVVAEAATAAQLEEDLETQIAAASGVIPSIEVVGVPDVAALAAATRAWERAQVPDRPTSQFDLGRLHRVLTELLEQVWPTDAAGPLLTWSLEPMAGQESRLSMVHMGPPLGPAGEALLAQKLSGVLGSAVQVRDIALPSETQRLEVEGDDRWLIGVSRSADLVKRYDGLTLQVIQPAADPKRAAELSRMLHRELKQLDPGRVCTISGEEWGIRLSQDPCPLPTETPTVETPTGDGAPSGERMSPGPSISDPKETKPVGNQVPSRSKKDSKP